MKKLLIPLLFLFFSLSLNSQPVKQHGQLSVDGIYMVDQDKNPVILHGVSFGWHNWWPRFYNENAVQWLAEDWNCSVIRAAMGVEPEKGYLEKPAWSKKKIEAVIEAAIENDIYVIIDWHSHELHLEPAKEFFAEMSEKYGSYPNIIYEIYNEPVKDSWKDVKQYSIEVMDVIRENDPNNIILIGTPHWDQDVHIAADNPIEGYENIMYALHYYAATHGDFLRERGEYAMKKGLPLFVSEAGGMEASGQGAIDYEAWNTWINWMDDHKISRVYWSIADKDETCSMLTKQASSKGNWKESDLKEWGIKVREETIKNSKKISQK